MPTPETIANANALAHNLRRAGYRVEIVDDLADGVAMGVNIWKTPTDRYPYDTVWFYSSNNAVSWGPAFEHTANAGDPNLAGLILETLT